MDAITFHALILFTLAAENEEKTLTWASRAWAQTVQSIILNKVKSNVKDLESIQGMHLITDLAN